MKIAIDAGHGLHTPGKRCLKSIDPKETREWQLNSRIAARVCTELTRLGITAVRMDDPTGAVDVPLSQRARNAAGCDYYISIHHDSGISGGTGGGVTVFAYAGASKAALRLRDTLYRHVIAETGLKGNRAEPLKTANFAVLRETSMPAALIECGFMDSRTDTPLILTADFAARAATGIVKAVCELCGVPYKPKTNREDDNMIIYKKPADLPAWAKPTVDKLIARGSIKPEADGSVNITNDMVRVLVINDREGLYQ